VRGGDEKEGEKEEIEGRTQEQKEKRMKEDDVTESLVKQGFCQKPATAHMTQEFPPSFLIFEADLCSLMEPLTRSDMVRYGQNLAELEFIDEFDRVHSVFGWIFQQDGAPCHTLQRALDRLEENGDIVSGWPHMNHKRLSNSNKS
jgi:hypothetical protein